MPQISNVVKSAAIFQWGNGSPLCAVQELRIEAVTV